MSEIHADCPYFLHSSLKLYAMVHKPVDAPSIPAGSMYCANMEMLCHRAGDRRLICTYLSPLDAIMGGTSLSNETHFWPLDFRCVDTREFMRQHGRLSVSVNYAYAALNKRIVANHDGHPLMTYAEDTFDVPEGQRGHFSIQFSESVVAEIEDVYARAGLSNFGATLQAMSEWSREQVCEAYEAAIARMPKTVPIGVFGNEVVGQLAIYDPESADWLFVDVD